MRSMRILILTVFAMSFALFGQADTGHYYLMSYFKNIYPPNNDMSGGFFALSTDCIHWTELKDGAPVIPGSWIGEKLMRDPFIYLDLPNMTFRLVYTTGWTMKVLGYMEMKIENGKDFKNYKDWQVLDGDGHNQISIGVSEKITGATCTWAPEIFWDDLQQKHMIYWSTDAGAGKRAYYVLTSDFQTFTDPVKFFDPGYTEIDGDLYKMSEGLYYFVFKDERDESRRLYYVSGPTPQGPWSAVSPAMTTLAGVEGPSTIKIGNEYRVYFDPYNTRANYRMIKSSDFVTWKDGGMIYNQDNDNFYWSHCNVTEIPKVIYDWILTTDIKVSQKPLTPYYTTGNHFNVPGIYNVLGKRLQAVPSPSTQKAFRLPAGFYVTVDKNKIVNKNIQKAR